MTGWLSTLDDEAIQRERAGLRRELHPRGPADAPVDLAGNDYLGFAQHPAVVAAAATALREYGLGATASRLVVGTTNAHTALEARLAALLGTEAALVYSSGYLANLGALTAVVRPGALIVSDAHNHASLVDGCRLARRRADSGVTLVAPHNDVAAVIATLESAAPGPPPVVVTESVFSVDGDLAPLAQLHAQTRRRDGVLVVDDAHGVGVVGAAGAVASAGLAGEPDVVVTATLSKAFGAAGGVVAGPAQVIRRLVDIGRTFIYDTAPPPAVMAGALAALELIDSAEGDAARSELHARADRAATRLRAAGLAVSTPAGGILSCRASGPEAAVEWAAACRKRGVAVGCFRPPSTPDGSSRIRLTINAGVAATDFDQALEVVVAEAR